MVPPTPATYIYIDVLPTRIAIGMASSNNMHDLCSVTSWNIDGLKSKLKDDIFYDKVAKYDIIGLIETWSTDESQCVELVNNGLADFSYVFVPAVGECAVGRKSGGIILLIAKCPHVIWVQLSGRHFGWDRDMMCISHH